MSLVLIIRYSMKIAYQLSDIIYEKNSVVTVGSFDGVHLAHREVLGEVVRLAQSRKGRSVLVTFDPHPKEVVTGKPVPLLTTLEERVQLCSELGIDLFFAIPFTYEFSRQTSREFYIRYLVQRIGVSEVVEGFDHHFGRDREGSVEDMLKLGKEFEFSVVAMKPVYVKNELVSSTGIRKHLIAGNIERPADLLGRPYNLGGTVVKGDGRGKALGFPTANIRLSSDKKLIPQNGIYFVRVLVGNREQYGMVSIGVRPTFHENGARTVEVNILNFQDEIYNQTIELYFLKRLRDELKFNSADELIRQMNRDKEESLKLLAAMRSA
ncbi:MAG: bifunctional riboflavin kinase/FAD synthetase [Ignavibacteriales bacterium]|nr:bifunctional riboflavin kinase/FAD synthetase [Ignavibacteriales bacterium]